jgi:hypothetical protein
VDRVCGSEEIRARSVNLFDGCIGVLHVDELNLPDHQGWIRIGGESSSLADDPGSVACRGDDGRFLDGHRNQVVTPVDEKIKGDSEWKTQDPDHVLDHVIRDGEGERGGGFEVG